MCGLEYDDEERRLCWAGTGGGHVLSGIQGSYLASHGVGSSARGVGQAIVADHSLIVNETSQLRPKKKCPFLPFGITKSSGRVLCYSIILSRLP